MIYIIIAYIYASHHSHPWSINPLVLCTLVLEKTLFIFIILLLLFSYFSHYLFSLPCSGESSVASFPPLLCLLDNVYAQSDLAKLFDG